MGAPISNVNPLNKSDPELFRNAGLDAPGQKDLRKAEEEVAALNQRADNSQNIEIPPPAPAPGDSTVEEKKGKPLSEVFAEDKIEKSEEEKLMDEVQNPSFLEKLQNTFSNWFKTTPTVSESTKVEETTKVEKSDSLKPVDRVPVLEHPDNLKVSDKDFTVGGPNAPEQIMIANMTMEKLIEIAIKGSLELNEVGGHVRVAGFKKQQEIKKKHDELLDAARDLIARDSNIAAIFGTAENLAKFVAAIGTVAQLAGYTNPFTALAFGAVTITTMLSHRYFKQREQESRATEAQFAYTRDMIKGSIDDYLKRLTNVAEVTTQLQNMLITLAKREKQLKEIAMQR